MESMRTALGSTSEAEQIVVTRPLGSSLTICCRFITDTYSRPYLSTSNPVAPSYSPGRVMTSFWSWEIFLSRWFPESDTNAEPSGPTTIADGRLNLESSAGPSSSPPSGAGPPAISLVGGCGRRISTVMSKSSSPVTDPFSEGGGREPACLASAPSLDPGPSSAAFESSTFLIQLFLVSQTNRSPFKSNAKDRGEFQTAPSPDSFSL
mmetsp:Transcript_22464/g.49108  ORF Transcript_22464/g.49108 Transcript_22464/m.49108 type:complete len:207 (+) Transcript_22464:748-1368(+)